MEEKKVVVAYVVKRYEDGSVDVEDAKLEETQEMGSEEIFKDIEDVAKLIANKRVENAAYVGAYRGTAKFYEDYNAAQVAQAEAEVPVEE